MKKFLKAVAVLAAVLVSLVAAGLLYVSLALPDVDVETTLSVEPTPDRLARGEYLANHVALCMDCHSTREWSEFSGPPIPGTEGVGGELFDQNMGFPGRYYAPNITPAGIGDWSDGELFRAITAGVSRDGRALFPIMPWPNYGAMDREDIYSIMAYIRTLPEQQHDVPASSSDFPMNFIINMMPQKGTFTTLPSQNNVLAYGEYITNASGCNDCHTKSVRGKPVDGMEFAGDFEFRLPDGSTVRSANITPEMTTGIGAWTRDIFITRFKVYQDSAQQHRKLRDGEYITPMPWVMYAGMEEHDLGAIYDYLRSVPAVENQVTVYTPAEKP